MEITMTNLAKIVKKKKKKKKDTKSVVKQVYKGVKGDWDTLMRGLGSGKKKKKLARPGK